MTKNSSTEKLNNNKTDEDFSCFGLHPLLAEVIKKDGYTVPTPIQMQTIPLVMQKRDVIGIAQTGTGKTAAFALPILNRLIPLSSTSSSPAKHLLQALILTPTRELTDQIHQSFRHYGGTTLLRTAAVFGGVPIHPQKQTLHYGIEILVATPGRLLDHIRQKNINLSQVKVLVLDEADRMLDMGFLPDLDQIIRFLPENRQSLLFSATFSDQIRKLGRSYLKKPVEIEVAKCNAIASTLRQMAHLIPGEKKKSTLLQLLRDREPEQAIVFTNSRAGAASLSSYLKFSSFKAASIHGSKTQSDRMKTLELFKRGLLKILVATDVAARGLNIIGVPCVINFDLPCNPQDYVHRIGRTGRAGTKGDAITLYTLNEEKYLIEIEKLIMQKIPRSQFYTPMLQPARGFAQSICQVSHHNFYKESSPNYPDRSTYMNAEKKKRQAVLLGGKGKDIESPGGGLG